MHDSHEASLLRAAMHQVGYGRIVSRCGMLSCRSFFCSCSSVHVSGGAAKVDVGICLRLSGNILLISIVLSILSLPLSQCPLDFSLLVCLPLEPCFGTVHRRAP